MPRFKTPDYGLKLIPLDFAQQVLRGTLEFAFYDLVNNELDPSTLRACYATALAARNLRAPSHGALQVKRYSWPAALIL